MPKVVDNYVLERSIGKGQFGEVFKGYNKSNSQDIAVKCVKRYLWGLVEGYAQGEVHGAA